MIIYTSTKSKPKRTPKSKLIEYEKWCQKHNIKPFAKKKRTTSTGDKSPVEVSSVYRRDTPYYPSRDSNVTGAVTTNVGKNKYTGDKLIGIASMHKSNLVPVFGGEEAIEVSQMRRN